MPSSRDTNLSLEYKRCTYCKEDAAAASSYRGLPLNSDEVLLRLSLFVSRFFTYVSYAIN
jgi:hypothetical protein